MFKHNGFEHEVDRRAQAVIDSHPGTNLTAAYRAVALELATARSGEPPQPHCPKCGSENLRLIVEATSLVMSIYCINGHDFFNLQWPKGFAQFFGPSAPQPARPPKQRDADLIVPPKPPRLADAVKFSHTAESLGSELWDQWFCRAMTSKETWMKHVMPILDKYFPCAPSGERWYTKEELHDALIARNYEPKIADELAGWITDQLELAYRKGKQHAPSSPSGSAGQEPLDTKYVFDALIAASEALPCTCVAGSEDGPCPSCAANHAAALVERFSKQKVEPEGRAKSELECYCEDGETCETCKPSTPEPVVSASPAPTERTITLTALWHLLFPEGTHSADFIHNDVGEWLDAYTEEVERYTKTLAAAQPVAADLPQSSESEVMPPGTDKTTEQKSHACRSDSASAASLKTSGLANPPKVEEIADEIIQMLRECGWLYATRTTPIAGLQSRLAAILGPFFAQVSQPPTEILTDLMLELHHALDMGGKLTLPIQIQMKKADEYLNGLVPKLAAPVTPVSGNGTEPVAQCRFCKQFGCQGQCLSRAGAASHNGQGWRPIETAPKDGRHIQAADFTPGQTGFGGNPPQSYQCIVHWWQWCDGTHKEEWGWYLSTGAGESDALTNLTHWKPLEELAALPAPPSEADGPQAKDNQ